MIGDLLGCVDFGLKGLKKRRFLEKGQAQNLEEFAEAALHPWLLLHDRRKHVDADGDSDLCLHRVVARAEDGLNAKVLLYPRKTLLQRLGLKLPRRLKRIDRPARV